MSKDYYYFGRLFQSNNWLKKRKTSNLPSILSSVKRDNVPIETWYLMLRYIRNFHWNIRYVGEEFRDAYTRNWVTVLTRRLIVVYVHVVEMLVFLQRSVVDMVMVHCLVYGVNVLDLLHLVRHVDHHLLTASVMINTSQFA